MQTAPTAATTTSNGAVDRIAADLGSLIQSLNIANTEIPDFGGSTIEDSLKWLDLYERRTSTWSDSLRLERLHMYFTGTAQYWLNSLKKDRAMATTFPEFRKMFCKKFVDKDLEELALRKIRGMSFDLDEHRVATFVIDYKHWYDKHKPNATTKEILRDLIERFPMKFQIKFLECNSLDSLKSVDEFVVAAERIEKCMRMKSKEKAAFMSAKSKSNDVMSQLLNELKEIRSEFAEFKKQAEKKRSGKRCYKCNGEWPSCGCVSECRTCKGSYPTCGCRRNRANPAIVPGNEQGSRA